MLHLIQAATAPHDTVYIATRAVGPSNDWAVGALAGIALSLAGWALTRTVQHGEAIRHLVTFTGSDGNNGLASSFAEVKETLAELVSIGHANRADLEMLKERSLHMRGN